MNRAEKLFRPRRGEKKAPEPGVTNILKKSVTEKEKIQTGKLFPEKNHQNQKSPKRSPAPLCKN